MFRLHWLTDTPPVSVLMYTKGVEYSSQYQKTQSHKTCLHGSQISHNMNDIVLKKSGAAKALRQGHTSICCRPCCRICEHSIPCESWVWYKYPGRFLCIISRGPSVSKSNQLHVDIFRFFFIVLRHIL